MPVQLLSLFVVHIFCIAKSDLEGISNLFAREWKRYHFWLTCERERWRQWRQRYRAWAWWNRWMHFQHRTICEMRNSLLNWYEKSIKRIGSVRALSLQVLESINVLLDPRYFYCFFFSSVKMMMIYAKWKYIFLSFSIFVQYLSSAYLSEELSWYGDDIHVAGCKHKNEYRLTSVHSKYEMETGMREIFQIFSARRQFALARPASAYNRFFFRQHFSNGKINK